LSENSEVESLVRSAFTIKDTFARDEGSIEYSISYDDRSRAAFRTLFVKLAPLGYTPHLSGSPDNAVLVVSKETEQPKSTARTPVFLVLLSVVAIIATGWGVGLIYAQVIGGSVIVIGASFVLAVTAVLVARDLAQRFVTRRGANVPALRYYLPNIPLFVSLPVLYFLPTFGSITFLRSPAMDRDSLFDFYFAGAVAGAAVAFAVALIGAPNALDFAVGQPGTLSTNPSLLQTLALGIGGNSLSATVPSGEVALFSPLEIGAWIGFLISFFSLVPAALFDGGRMATLVLGERGSRITTMVTAFLLVAIDVPNYWVIFLLIFLLAAIQPSNETLDSITRISNSRRLLFLGVIVLVLVCIPIPQTFLLHPV
jgi:membrane-associated protease RseP (regulator of RpoE activity)